MLNIPNDVKNLFKLDSCHKNFHVHFPNGEMDDLGNADVVQESVEFSESICSQNTFKFGKSESSTIEFETVGVPNMMGMKIECGIEVDCSSLGAQWAAEHPVDNTLPFLTPQTVDTGHTLVENGEIISVYNDGFDTLEDMKVALTPVQDLHGYSKPWAGGAGENRFEPIEGSDNLITFVTQADGSVKISGTGYITKWTARNVTYDLPYHGINAGDTVTIWSDIYFVVTPYNGSTSLGAKSSSNGVATTFTIPANANKLRLGENAKAGQVQQGEVIDVVGHFFIGKVDTFSSWTPFSNVCPLVGSTGLSVYVSPTQDQQDATTYAEDWTSQAGTVYAGSIDVVSGALKVRPHYASYNGETLVGPWMSSMDEYAAGVTPTTGAEVVDLGGTETAYQLTAQDIVLLPAQNYLWASNSGMIRAEFKKSAKMYYRVPYGLFTVRSCPRDHQAMTHRKVTAYTNTRSLTTDYQTDLMDANGFEKKYTPKFQNMFYAAAGRNNEDMLLDAGYTISLHAKLSSLQTDEAYGIIRFPGPLYFKTGIFWKNIVLYSGNVQDWDRGYSASGIYGLESFEKIKNTSLVESIASVLVSDYNVPESLAYDYELYDNVASILDSPDYHALPSEPKILAYVGVKSISGGYIVCSNKKKDLADLNGLYCISPDRKGMATVISVISGISLTPWSNDDVLYGHAIGDPIVANAQGLDDAYLNQYAAPSGGVFDFELNLNFTGNNKTAVSGVPYVYSFSGAIDFSNLSTNYLEINAMFASQNRFCGYKFFSLDDNAVETIMPAEYSNFWWDEYDVSPIGKIKYVYKKKDKEETLIYDFGDGQSMYDMTANDFFNQLQKSQSEIESILSSSFVPHAGVVAFTPIELTIGNGLPYFEAGDCIEAVAEDLAVAKSYILTQRISGIQHLIQEIESSGGNLTGTAYEEVSST